MECEQSEDGSRLELWGSYIDNYYSNQTIEAIKAQTEKVELLLKEKKKQIKMTLERIHRAQCLVWGGQG